MGQFGAMELTATRWTFVSRQGRAVVARRRRDGSSALLPRRRRMWWCDAAAAVVAAVAGRVAAAAVLVAVAAAEAARDPGRGDCMLRLLAHVSTADSACERGHEKSKMAANFSLPLRVRI